MIFSEVEDDAKVVHVIAFMHGARRRTTDGAAQLAHFSGYTARGGESQ